MDLAAWLSIPYPADEAAQWIALESCIAAASRAIDRATGRQFGKVAEPETRWYKAQFFKDRWVIDIDDLMTTDDLAIEINDVTLDPADYALTPRNAVQQGKPWTSLEILPRSPVKPTGEVCITAWWGWAAVPRPVELATMIQASRFYERRDNPAGPLTVKQIDDVRYGWAPTASTELDADVAASIAGYRKLWFAV
ncbi:hypothetical protein CYL16_01130 [Mycobacterium sp. EPG1]|nr:hypothetical protein CYL16_01130 [Mycobacterium sp. EPG1]